MNRDQSISEMPNGFLYWPHSSRRQMELFTAFDRRTNELAAVRGSLCMFSDSVPIMEECALRLYPRMKPRERDRLCKSVHNFYVGVVLLSTYTAGRA